MYDMYPEWGPGRQHEPQPSLSGPSTLQPVQVGIDLRDNGGQRPDDN